ncbi:MAG: SMP-30/gluconolactonase/LRE family protein [Flavobacteriaceae bacterium]
MTIKYYYIALILSTLLFSCEEEQTTLIAEGAELSLVADGFLFTEGPAADTNGDVFFTDQPNNRILKWSEADNTISTYMEPAGRANGLYFDHDGNLLAAADENFELWRIDPEKKVTALFDAFQGKKLNGPNDIWVDPKGGIYFTDPYYQRPYWSRSEKEMKREGVYYIAPNQLEVKMVVTDFVRPNGLIGTPDGKTLYITDAGDDKTYVFAIAKNGSLEARKIFVNMRSDGMTLDERGNVYLTGDGVSVFNKNGEQLLHIAVPEKWTANLTFGGADRSTLFITASKGVYTLKMNVSGANK